MHIVIKCAAHAYGLQTNIALQWRRNIPLLNYWNHSCYYTAICFTHKIYAYRSRCAFIFSMADTIVCFPGVTTHCGCIFTAQLRALASSFSRFVDHTQRRATVRRTPLDEWSARRLELYLTTHKSKQTNIHAPDGIQTQSLSRQAPIEPPL